MKARRERRRIGALLTRIRAARSEREMVHVVHVMLWAFGGLEGFTRAYTTYHAYALDQLGRFGRGAALFRSMSALIECLKYTDDRSRARLPQLSDDELGEWIERRLAGWVADRPESVAALLRARGWRVERTCDDPVDSNTQELALSGG